MSAPLKIMYSVSLADHSYAEEHTVLLPDTASSTCQANDGLAWTLTHTLYGIQVSALRVDVQRLNHGKRSAEVRAVAAENAAQHAQHELAALKMLTASMLGQAHGGAAGPFQEPESIESVKAGSTLQTSSSVVDTLTQQRGSCVRPPPPVHLHACSLNAPPKPLPFTVA